MKKYKYSDSIYKLKIHAKYYVIWMENIRVSVRKKNLQPKNSEFATTTKNIILNSEKTTH